MSVSFREIHDCPGYRVGDDGSIWSSWQKNGRQPYRRSSTWVKLRPYSRYSGHQYIQIKNADGKKIRRQVHRIVLWEFVGPPPDGHEACHGDGNASNNSLSNLRWGTRSENCLDRSRHGTLSGERHGRAKLSANDVAEARRMRASGSTYREIAERFGISASQAKRVAIGEQWKNLPGERDGGGWDVEEVGA